MVSEDSQDLGGLPKVHGLRDLRDLDETWHREMPAELHQTDDLGELGEVVSLRRSQRVRRKNGMTVLASSESPISLLA